MLHQTVIVWANGQEIDVTLDIVPDEFEPHAELKAFDQSGVQLARVQCVGGIQADQGERRAVGRARIRYA